jgi:hypothetical protein
MAMADLSRVQKVKSMKKTKLQASISLSCSLRESHVRRQKYEKGLSHAYSKIGRPRE